MKAQILIFVIFVATAIYSAFSVLSGFDYVKEIYFYSGIFALAFLFLSIIFAISRPFLKIRANLAKSFGLFSFFYALLHFLNYFVLEKNASIARVIEDLTLRQASGLLSFVILLFMFFSSFKFFAKISKIRKLGILALILASYHFFLAAKSPNVLEFGALGGAIMLAIWYVILNLKMRAKGAKARA